MGALCRSPVHLVLSLLLFVHSLGASSPDDGKSGCRRGVISCMRCDSSNTSKCAKCSQLVVLTPGCAAPTDCPPGYTTSAHWTSFVDYMTSVCKERLGVGGMSGEAVGATVGLVVCVLAALATFFYCRLKSNRRPPPSLTHSSQGSGGYDSDWSSVEFVKEVSQLRRDSALFLAMLNDTRRQVRELTSQSALQPYKPVLKDLSRILILVNRPKERLGQPPPDWETLLAWAHRVLNRYKKHHPNQVNELVNFLSGGSRDAHISSVFDSNYNTKKSPREYKEAEYDDPPDYQRQPPRHFFTLGFRPQDEITTEL